jgi:hypothetical protein
MSRGEGGRMRAERGGCCISFSGAGGYLTVTVVEDAGGREVDVETREFEYPARRFLEGL